MKLGLSIVLVCLCGCAAKPTPTAAPTEVLMTTSAHGNECLLTLGKQQFLTERLESAALAKQLNRMRGQTVLLQFSNDVPYRCIGSAIIMLQRGNAKFRAPQLPSG
jgi:hypothetical protein